MKNSENWGRDKLDMEFRESLQETLMNRENEDWKWRLFSRDPVILQHV